MFFQARDLFAKSPQFGRFPVTGHRSSSHWTGAVAQMGERVVRNDEVRGSIPLGSTSVPVLTSIFAHPELAKGPPFFRR